MNSIANAQNASLNKVSPPPAESDVQSAINRVESLIYQIEGRAQDLEMKLHSVLVPASPEPTTGAQCTASSPVPLASGLHTLADRLESLHSVYISLLNRLHV